MAKKGDRISHKQRRFIAEYLKDQNASQAAIRSGYSKKNADVVGPRLLGYVRIRAAIDEKLQKVERDCGVTVEYVLTGLKEVAQRCLQRAPVMVRDGNEMVQKTDDDDRDVWEFDSNGANRSLELLGKHKRMFTDKVEHSGTLSLEQIIAGTNDPSPSQDQAMA